jgi:HAE1 family hydrophobic/amphiphilic exporter-1
VRFTYGPQFIMRQNMYRAAMLNVEAAEGYTSAQVMQALEDTFARTMPGDMGYSYSGMSYQQKKAAEGMSLAGIFAISGVFAYLLMAALYESWSLPISIVLSVPVAILGAFATLWVAGQQLDLYAEIGLIMLIGLAAKNAILVVEFAEDRRVEGMPLLQATLAGAKARLRTILMTSFAFILGCVPLALATGPGAEARRSIGITVIGGMSVAALIGILFIPFCYYLIAKHIGTKVPGSEK